MKKLKDFTIFLGKCTPYRLCIRDTVVLVGMVNGECCWYAYPSNPGIKEQEVLDSMYDEIIKLRKDENTLVSLYCKAM